MNHVISVREHAWLTTETVAASLDCAQVSESAFDHLCQLSASFSRSGARLLQVEGRRRLKLDNYVGVVQTPCGTTLEVLPKHHAHADSLTECRALLRKMIQTLLKVPTRVVGQAPLELFDAPLSEWVMRRFLDELDILVTGGLRFDYLRIEEEMPFLRGQLALIAQQRQPPGKAHLFHMRHDVYLPDRPENRLLKSALEQVRRTTQQPDSWRLAQELSMRLAEIPASRQVNDDFKAWGTDRLMARYQATKPWCELILRRQMPLSVLGKDWGMSLLFPMEKLFEGYVTAWLRRQLAPGLDVRTPAAFASLCIHEGERIFQLQPDIYVRQGEQRWVLDTKWKRLDAADRSNKYGLSQSDFYQLYAYGQKYLNGKGSMALIYPRDANFQEPLPPFDMGDGLILHVLPFDLDDELLLGRERLELPFTATASEDFQITQSN